MTQPPSGGQPDPYQPQQPYGQNYDPTSPYAQDPYAAPADGSPASASPTSGYPASGSPTSGYPASGQPAGYPPQGYPAGGVPYGQNPYGAQQYPGYGPQTRTNALAIASLVCSIAGLVTCISAPVGVVLGHIARRQIRQTGEQGEGMATAGLWVGYILTVLGALFFAGWLALVIFAIGSSNTTT
jgi:hypothetical protein